MRINHLSFPKNKKQNREQRGMHIALERKKKQIQIYSKFQAFHPFSKQRKINPSSSPLLKSNKASPTPPIFSK